MPTRSTILSTRLSVLLLLSLLAACSSPRVFTSQDPSADFGAYRTYGFVDPLDTDNPDYSSILSEFLKLAASRELEARGYAPADEPDLLVNFVLDTKQKTRTQTTSAYPHHQRRYGGYSGYETTSYEYTEGTLHVDLIDLRRNQLVWEGVLVGQITDSQRHKLRDTCDNALRDVFQQYPYVAGVSVPARTDD